MERSNQGSQQQSYYESSPGTPVHLYTEHDGVNNVAIVQVVAPFVSQCG
jgi:hypothetical protein